MPINWKTAVATGLEKVSFHSKPMEGQCQRIECTQFHSFHIPVRSCSKSSKLSFNNMWTKNFQMYKLDLEDTEEPEIKLTTFFGSQTKQGNSRKTSTSGSLTMLKSLTVWITTKWKIRDGNTRTPTCLLRNLYAAQEALVRNGHGTMNWFKTGKGVHQGWILSLCFMQSTSC